MIYVSVPSVTALLFSFADLKNHQMSRVDWLNYKRNENGIKRKLSCKFYSIDRRRLWKKTFSERDHFLRKNFSCRYRYNTNISNELRCFNQIENHEIPIFSASFLPIFYFSNELKKVYFDQLFENTKLKFFFITWYWNLFPLFLSAYVDGSLTCLLQMKLQFSGNLFSQFNL